MILVMVSDLNIQYRVSSCIWSIWPARVIRSRIKPHPVFESRINVMYRTSEIGVDLGYNPAAVPKSIDRIHRVRCPAKNRADVPVHFVFVTGPESFQSEEPSPLPGMENGSWF